MTRLAFKPLYWQDKLKVINPYGTIGIVTLWSSTEYIEKLLRHNGVSLEQHVSVIGTLYGNGLREMLRNLLYNPQIDTLIVFGRNRSKSYEDLKAFFENGIEPLKDSPKGVLFENAEPVIIKGRNRIIDNLVTPEMFRNKPQIFFAGEPEDNNAIQRIKDFLGNYQPRKNSHIERLYIPLPKFKTNYFPSNPRSHVVCEEDVLSAWKELIHRLFFFGHPVELRKGKRRELQNLKVVVENPWDVPWDELEKYGFDKGVIENYQKEFLNGLLQEDVSYTYGHRMISYFGFSQIERVIQKLKADPEDRRSLIATWDTRRDLLTKESVPCLISIFFRRFDGKLTLSANFRTHNAMDAWMLNVFGLMALLEYVANGAEMEKGSITTISYSISIDEKELDRASQIAYEKKFKYRLDPMGYFKVYVDKEIIVEYCHGDVVLKTYSGNKASKLQHEIAKDGIISEISHAIYLGRQLERAEMCLREGKEFFQD